MTQANHYEKGPLMFHKFVEGEEIHEYSDYVDTEGVEEMIISIHKKGTIPYIEFEVCKTKIISDQEKVRDLVEKMIWGDHEIR